MRRLRTSRLLRILSCLLQPYAGVYSEGLFFNAHCDNVLDQAKDRLISINLHDAVHVALGIARGGLDEVHACVRRVYLGILAKNHHEDRSEEIQP